MSRKEIERLKQKIDKLIAQLSRDITYLKDARLTLNKKLGDMK